MESTTNWAGIVGSVVRFALGGLAGGLAVKGVITPEQAEFLIVSASAAAVAVGGLIWIWVKTRAAAKLENTTIKVALKATPSTPVEVVKAEAAAEVANK